MKKLNLHGIVVLNLSHGNEADYDICKEVFKMRSFYHYAYIIPMLITAN